MVQYYLDLQQLISRSMTISLIRKSWKACRPLRSKALHICQCGPPRPHQTHSGHSRVVKVVARTGHVWFRGEIKMGGEWISAASVPIGSYLSKSVAWFPKIYEPHTLFSTTSNLACSKLFHWFWICSTDVWWGLSLEFRYFSWLTTWHLTREAIQFKYVCRL